MELRSELGDVRLRSDGADWAQRDRVDRSARDLLAVDRPHEQVDGEPRLRAGEINGAAGLLALQDELLGLERAAVAVQLDLSVRNACPLHRAVRYVDPLVAAR